MSDSVARYCAGVWIGRKEAHELDRMVAIIIEWADVKDDLAPVSSGLIYNPRNNILSSHRPAMLYVLTALIVPILERVVYERRFACRERYCGSLKYFYRKRRGRQTPCDEPIVFIHGLGVGLLMAQRTDIDVSCAGNFRCRAMANEHRLAAPQHGNALADLDWRNIDLGAGQRQHVG